MTFPTAPLGGRGVTVTRLGLGTAPLGNMFTELAEHDADATVAAAWDAGVRLFDTAPFYGHGLAEERLGRALRARARDEFVLSSKVGRVLELESGLAADSHIIFSPPPELRDGQTIERVKPMPQAKPIRAAER